MALRVMPGRRVKKTNILNIAHSPLLYEQHERDRVAHVPPRATERSDSDEDAAASIAMQRAPPRSSREFLTYSVPVISSRPKRLALRAFLWAEPSEQ
ncbi:MAG TPA: hypothetical protein VK025_07845 [Steroidobacter sp.]|jgi:hypothetical protein|nr:hypothetical protein [Steroidobacter sp.]